jgi:hypothetical protein
MSVLRGAVLQCGQLRDMRVRRGVLLPFLGLGIRRRAVPPGASRGRGDVIDDNGVYDV